MEGAVTVNGRPALDLKLSVSPGDVVRVNGVALAQPDGRLVYLLLNKPPGFLSAVSDDRGRPTALDLVPDPLRAPGLVPAGRLDFASSGLLALTNDGELVNRITHPRYGVEKEYDALLDRPLSEAERHRLLAGVRTESGLASAAEVRAVRRREGGAQEPRYRVTLVEGKKREVRLMMAELGCSVQRLTRVRIGGARLGSLPAGAVRELTADEAHRLLGGQGRGRPGADRARSARRERGRAPARKKGDG